jgi:integrase
VSSAGQSNPSPAYGPVATASSGDTKTPQSKRSLVLPKRAIDALTKHKRRQATERLAAGTAWHDINLVFCHEDGHPYTKDALNWRFSKMTRRAGIGHWHAHEGRHTAVSIMSHNGVPIQERDCQDLWIEIFS